jgi:hypothetical protein
MEVTKKHFSIIGWLFPPKNGWNSVLQKKISFSPLHNKKFPSEITGYIVGNCVLYFLTINSQTKPIKMKKGLSFYWFCL